MKHKTSLVRSSACFGVGILLLVGLCVAAQTGRLTPVLPVPGPGPQIAAGSVAQNPPALFSQNGFLRVDFSYQTRTDSAGHTSLGFITPDGLQNPTLHVHPGDHLIIKLTNNMPASPVEMAIPSPRCGDTVLTRTSVSLHYHGTNSGIAPQDPRRSRS